MSVSLETTRRRGIDPTAIRRLELRPGRPTRTPAPLPPPPPELAVLHLSDADLCDLRRGLARALEETGLGSGASRIVARMSRLTRNEIARRERRRSARVEDEELARPARA